MIKNTYQIKTSSTPMFIKPKKNSSLETECLFGEKVLVKEKFKNWVFCQLTTDNYKGWLRIKDLSMPFKTTHHVIAPRIMVTKNSNIKSTNLGYLSLGSLVSVKEVFDDWAMIDFNFASEGGVGFIHKSQLLKKNEKMKDWVSVSEKLIHTPYKWGGRDTIGLDCSALVQLSLNASRIFLPRNTSDQINSKYFKEITFNQITRGCLIFWDGHVAITINETNIIHANAYHMKVQVEKLSHAINRLGNPVSVKILKKTM